MAEQIKAVKTATLPPSRMQEASFRERRWRVDVPSYHTLEQISHPVYWAHVARQLSPHDIISAVKDDNSEWFEFLVLSTGNERVFVKLLQNVEIENELEKLLELDGAAAVDQAVPAIVWKGPQAKFAIVRGQTIVAKGFATKPEAKEWLGSNKVA